MINDFSRFLPDDEAVKIGNIYQCTRFPRGQISTVHACRQSHLLPARFKNMSNLLK